MSGFDENINNYTIEELLTILGNPSTLEEMLKISNDYINKYKNENNKNMIIFFKNLQNMLINYFNQETLGVNDLNTSNLNKQTSNWWKNNPALPQENENQTNKITDRNQKIDIYDSPSHLPMSRQQLGVNNTYNLPVVQDKLNPNLENITLRYISLDSSFRQASNDGDNSSSSEYVCDLSDKLSNVLSLRLYSIQIPYSWYNVDETQNNTCFWVYNNNNNFKITISSGNYNITSFVSELIQAFLNEGFSPITTSHIFYTTTSGKLTINLNNVTDPLGNIIESVSPDSNNTNPAKFIFFDFSNTLSCSTGNTCNSSNVSFNNTMGWIMGFRSASLDIFTTGNTADAILNLYGPRYIVLILDDFNQNHINNDLITITEINTKLEVPSYYTNDLSYICTNYNNTNIYNSLNSQSNATNDNLMFISSEKIDDGVITIPQIIPNAPRTITQSQIYTINQIVKNNSKTTRYKKLAFNPCDTFAVIYLDTNGLSLGDVITEDGSTLQVNKRQYFGPVDIDRLRVRLTDEKGNTINLNGLEWNCIIIAECLYQY